MTATMPPPLSVLPSGAAIYFDGITSARHDVFIQADENELRVIDADWRLLEEWPYAELRRQSAPDGVLRLGRRGATVLARLEVRDEALAAAIEDRAVSLDRGGARARQLRRKVLVWSFAAAASLIVTGIFGVPALTSRLIPFVPISMEQKLGKAVDKRVRSAIDARRRGAAFECGNTADEMPGRAALNKLIGELTAVADLPLPLRVDVVRRAEPNAFALPGGRIYVYEGLIAKAQTPDELAGVLAHEIGHVAHRDGTRTVLQAAGLSFLFGMMLGDFVGGGAVVIAARVVLKSSYSRHVEAAADTYSVDLMTKAGGDPRALSVILARIVGDKKRGMKILENHPDTKDRITAINAIAISSKTSPLLDAADWSALKRICAPLPAAGIVKPPAAAQATKASDDGAAANR